MIDAAVTEAAAAGIEQFAIVGAGLDTRAHRLSVLQCARVFEVDHPDSQRFKRAHLGERAPCARELRHVPVRGTVAVRITNIFPAIRPQGTHSRSTQQNLAEVSTPAKTPLNRRNA